MRIKLSDYIAQFLVSHGVKDVFTVTGGGAMHLNDSFGHYEGLNCIYNHHEQGSAIAAESYARLTGKVPVLCVTTGPGGINALTGVFGAWV
nr:thiamine pyrophosphate-binding protein [Lachnospiraceae bacterium]